MSENNNIVLNRIFSRNILSDLINGKQNNIYNVCIKRYVDDSSIEDNLSVIKSLYGHITKKHRNEYYYKNTLLNKLLLGRHSLKTTTVLSEIPINKSKADFVLINGKAVVYEIKTELDTLYRLSNQMSDYFKAFSNVCVVTHESNYKRIMETLEDSNVGIFILTNKGTLSVRREPVENCAYLDSNVLFKILRKKEFENILLSHYHKLPITKQVYYYRECFKLFDDIDIRISYAYFLSELKKRSIKEIEDFKKYVPYELKYLVYFSSFKKYEYLKLNQFLEKKFGG